MAKITIKFLSIWFFFFLTFVSFAIYRDLKVKKVFNYSSTAAVLESKRNAVSQNDQYITSYVFKIKSNDNYFGAVLFPLKNLLVDSGSVTFRLRDASSNVWYTENKFDIAYFKDFGQAPYGIPPIENSKSKDYLFEIELVSSDVGKEINEEIVNGIEFKYVFPRNVALDNPQVLMSIITHRLDGILNIFSRIQFIYFFSLSTFLTILITFFVFRNNVVDTGSLQNIPYYRKVISIFFKHQYVIYLSLGVFIITIIFTVSGEFDTAEKYASYFWILLLITAIFLVYKSFEVGEMIRMVLNKQFGEKDYKVFTYGVIGLLFAIVIISGFTTTYLLGGDDTRLYFVYPDLFLKYFASKIVSETALSNIQTMLTPNSTAYTAFLMLVLKSIFRPLNLQSMLYTANLLFGMVTFYIFIKWMIGERGSRAFVIYGISSFMYVFSIYNFYTLLNSNLMSVFLISTFPIFLYCIFRGIDEKKLYLIIPAGILASLFSYFSLAIPVFAASMVTVIPFIIYFLFCCRLRTVLYFIFLGVFLILLNLYWIVYIPTYSRATIDLSSADSGVLSTNFRKENEAGIRAVSDTNSVYYPLLNSYHKAIQVNFSWPFYPIYSSWYEKLLPFNYVFIGIILLAGFTISHKNKLTLLYTVALSTFLFSIYFFTVDITSFGIPFFVWLNSTIPGFVMFRNMYDKFAYPLAFSFAFMIAVSLTVLSKSKISFRRFQVILTITLFVSVLNGVPYMAGWFQELPIWTTKNIHSRTVAFNDDFVHLMNYMQNDPDPARYLILPLTTGNSFHIQDSVTRDNYYNGGSPLVILTGKNDLSGSLSFGPLRLVVEKAVRNKDYETLGKLLQSLNVKYIILNKDVPVDLQNSFVYAEGFYYAQDEPFINSFLGEKIADFGSRYTLYRINRNYTSEKIYLTDNLSSVPDMFDNLTFSRKASHLYEINISSSAVKENTYLVFLDMNLKGWKLLDQNGKEVGIRSTTSPFGYANAWQISPDMFADNNGDINLTLFYDPYRYYWPVLMISVSAFIGSFAIFVFFLITDRKSKESGKV